MLHEENCFKNKNNMAKKDLRQAKKSKNDEFYTQLSDIEKEEKNIKSNLKIKLFTVIQMTRLKVISLNILLQILICWGLKN